MSAGSRDRLDDFDASDEAHEVEPTNDGLFWEPRDDSLAELGFEHPAKASAQPLVRRTVCWKVPAVRYVRKPAQVAGGDLACRVEWHHHEAGRRGERKHCYAATNATTDASTSLLSQLAAEV